MCTTKRTTLYSHPSPLFFSHRFSCILANSHTWNLTGLVWCWPLALICLRNSVRSPHTEMGKALKIQCPSRRRWIRRPETSSGEGRHPAELTGVLWICYRANAQWTHRDDGSRTVLISWECVFPSLCVQVLPDNPPLTAEHNLMPPAPSAIQRRCLNACWTALLLSEQTLTNDILKGASETQPAVKMERTSIDKKKRLMVVSPLEATAVRGSDWQRAAYSPLWALSELLCPSFFPISCHHWWIYRVYR